MLAVPDGPHSFLEFDLEHAAAPPPAGTTTQQRRTRNAWLRTPGWRDTNGPHHGPDFTPPDNPRAIGPLTIDEHGTWPHDRRHRHRRRHHDTDPPPF